MQTESTPSIKHFLIQSHELPHTLDIDDKKDYVKVMWLMAHAMDLYLRATDKINDLKWGYIISTGYDTFIWDGRNAVPIFNNEDNRFLLDPRFANFDLDQEFKWDLDQGTDRLINFWHSLLNDTYDLWLDLSKYTHKLLSNMFAHRIDIFGMRRYATYLHTDTTRYFVSDYHSWSEEQDSEQTREAFKQRFQDTLKKGVVLVTSIYRFTNDSEFDGEFIVKSDSTSQSTLAEISLAKPIEFGTKIGLVQADQTEKESKYDITVVDRPDIRELVSFIERQHDLFADKLVDLEKVVSEHVLPDISKSILGYLSILD